MTTPDHPRPTAPHWVLSLLPCLCLLLIIPRNASAQQAYEFAKLLSFATANRLDPDLQEAADVLAEWEPKPVYVVLPQQEPVVETDGTSGNTEGTTQGNSSSQTKWTVPLAIYQKEVKFSASSKAVAYFVQDLSHQEDLVGALSQIEREGRTSLNDGDLAILNVVDLDRLHKIALLSKVEGFSENGAILDIVNRFDQTVGDHKHLVFAHLHPQQITIVTGMNSRDNKMSVIHCFPDPIQPMVAFDITPEKQEPLRAIIEIAKQENIPVNVRAKLTRVGDALTNDDREHLADNLSLRARHTGRSVGRRQDWEVNHTAEELMLFTEIPWTTLHGVNLYLSLLTERFRFLDCAGRKREEKVQIEICDWSHGSAATGGNDTRAGSRRDACNQLKVVEPFAGDGIHDDFSYYIPSPAVVAQFARAECLAAATSRQSRRHSADVTTATDAALGVAPAGCEEALRYAEAIAREIYIAAKLLDRRICSTADSALTIEVILRMPTSRWTRPQVKARAASVALVDYLRREAEHLGLGSSVVPRLSRVEATAESEQSIEIRFVMKRVSSTAEQAQGSVPAPAPTIQSSGQ